MKSVNTLDVYYQEKKVGTLAKAGKSNIAFSYDSNWLNTGFAISPFSLPLKEGVFIAEKPYFGGLYGVFGDSLPDSWGRLLVDCELKSKGIDPGELSQLDRLSIVGSTGKGALTYKPNILEENLYFDISDLDSVAEDAIELMQHKDIENLDAIYFAGASSGGARPKINTEIDGTEWIIKFPATVDQKEIGYIEKQYSDCAKKCGIPVPQTKLFSSKKCKGYFGSERFDRVKSGDEVKKIHMLTVAAILELDFTMPSLDYNSLMKLTKILTHDDEKQLKIMFKLMCYNVFAHNRDDHSKNFTFLYDEDNDSWFLSPAYDLTYSNTYFGEQTTSVNGKGNNIEMLDIISVGTNAGLSKKFCEDEAEKIKAKAEKLIESIRKYL